ncbi:MAG: hypothetical protein V7K83_17890 [Nostoc sp.]
MPSSRSAHNNTAAKNTLYYTQLTWVIYGEMNLRKHLIEEEYIRQNQERGGLKPSYSDATRKYSL